LVASARRKRLGVSVSMFLCFILQIVARYVFNYPLGWTDEVSALCWICARWAGLSSRDEVRFDIITVP
jgi:hypothetical protein